jgi:hypothetical protein
MSLILSLDMMGKRYGLLPSDVISRATTFDLVIMDASVGYQAEMDRQNSKGYVPDIPLDDLMKIHKGEI